MAGFARKCSARSVYALLIVAILPSYSAAQRHVPPRTWRNNPAIRRIRNLSANIDAALALGWLTTRADSAECDGGSERVVAHLNTDSSGHARKDVLRSGSDDSAGEVRYYYDARGRLRLTYESFGAVNGTRRETRIYSDTTGAQIYKDVRLLNRPGYNGGFEPMISDPVADFRSQCGPPYPPQR